MKCLFCLHFFLGEAVSIAKHLYDLRKGNEFVYDNDKILWLIGSLGLDLRKDESSTKKTQKASKYSITTNHWKGVFAGGLFVEPHMPELAEFKKYFVDTLKVIF